MATPATRAQHAASGAPNNLEWRAAMGSGAARGRAPTRGTSRTTSQGGRSRNADKRGPPGTGKPDGDAVKAPAAAPRMPADPSKSTAVPSKPPTGRPRAPSAAKPPPPLALKEAGSANGPAAHPMKPSRSRRGTRRGSNAVPTLVVDPSTPLPNAVMNAPVPPSTAPIPGASPLSRPSSQRGRRRRSHNRSASARSSVSFTGEGARQQVVDAFAPTHTSATSAVPDMPSFDRSKVDDLVERMRATLVTSRSASPGSHHDWAEEDDDDTLPDLDDWGYSSNKGHSSPDERNDNASPEAISPILEDDLRPLPDPTQTPQVSESQSLPISDEGASAELESAIPAGEAADDENKKHAPHPLRLQTAVDRSVVAVNASSPMSGVSSASTVVPSHRFTPTSSNRTPRSAAFSPQPSSMSPQAKAGLRSPPPHLSSGRAPMHPSLPAKPLAAIAAQVDKSVPKRPESPAKQPEEAHPAASPSEENKGLGASIHAPGRRQVFSAPSHISSHPIPRAGRGGRAPVHGPGRSSDFRHSPLSASASATAFARQPELGGHRVDSLHNRSRSSPAGPSGGMSGGRNPLVHRPVITVDAINKLVKTLGGKGGEFSPAPKHTTVQPE